MIKGIILLIQFFTRIPLPVSVEYDEKQYVRSIIFIPLAGALIGGILAGTWYLGNTAGLPLASAALVALAGVLVTGGLHLDGLADTADGFYSCRDRERMLEIMRDSRIGTNGTLALILVLLVKTMLIMSLDREYALTALFVMPVFSRAAIPWLCLVSEYARPEPGMGSAIVNLTGWRDTLLTTITALAVTAPLALTGLGAHILTAGACAAAFALFTARYSRKKIGGTTGDVIGAMVEVCEPLCLLVFILSARYLPEVIF